MKKQTHPAVLVLVCFLFLWPSIQSQTCKPSGKIKAPKPRSGHCTIEDDPIVAKKASFTQHDKPIVALSTGWFSKKKRCFEYIDIHGNGKIVKAKVVDECDSTMGCDAEHDYYPPCRNNIVVAS
ncbi:hypothetical protein V6N11_004648 [Hibiscus sabdariffa]|uniref:Uncharacterized protein n=1 Tax=Hibiscus sabdariffa TaxID=183260 RepID=A0ABR2SHN6_9ROSI